MIDEEYKNRYAEKFCLDQRLSKEYSKDANRKLLSELAEILDYEAEIGNQPHPLDLQGYDRKINLTFGFGIRVRSIKKIDFEDFTVDYKEWNHEIIDPHYYYFYCYAQDPKIEHKIFFSMIFDYQKLKRLVKEGKIKSTTEQNKEHSLVKFYGFKIQDLAKNNLIITYDGTPEALIKLKMPFIKNKRIDRL